MLKNSKSKEKATNNLLPSIPIQPPPPKQEDAYLDSIFTPDYKKIDEEISSFYSEFVAILDSINVPTPPKKPDPIINEPDLPIIPSKKAVLKTRPISALVPRKLPLLVSEKIRRAVSARQYDETTTSLPPKTIHTEEFDSKLLSRLSNYKDIVVFQPDDREVRFEDDVKITDITWRSPTRPQSAVSKVISRPVSAKKTSRPVSARYLDPISRPNSSRPLSSRPKSARPSSSRPVSSKKRLALLDFDFDDEYVEETNPIHVQTVVIPEHLKSQLSSHKTFPLEWFDDQEFETRTGQEWVDYGKTKGNVYTIAYSRFFSYPESDILNWEWLPCNVIEYNSKKDSYLVEWHCNNQRKMVKRLNLIFDDEDRETFYNRLERAIKRRNVAENKRNYYGKIDSLIPDSAIGIIPDTMIQNVYKKIGPLASKYSDIVDDCYKEMDLEYIMSMKKSVFDVQHTHQIGNSSPASEKFAEFALSKTTHTQPELYSQLYNQVAVGARDLSTCLFSANSKFQTTILKCLDVLPKLLPESEWFFCKEFSYPVDFEFFFIRSKIHCELIQSRLSSEWPLQVSNVINTNLSELLNFNIKNIKIYQSSRTRDFLRLVSLIMSTQLRWFITQGMIKFLGILNIKSIRVGSPTVDDEHSRKETLEEFDSDMVHTVPHFDAVNLNAEVFLIKVTTTDIENSITVVSVPALRDIEDMVRFLFELPSELTRAVPGQESIIMNKIFMNPGDETFISGLENDNRLLAEGKLAIKKLLHESIKSLSSVIDLFTEFAFLINQSIDQEVDIELFNTNLKIYSDCLTRVGVLADTISAPPFVFQCKDIKATLVERAQQRMNGISNKLVDLLDITCQSLVLSYEDQFRKILLDPGAESVAWEEMKLCLEVCSKESEQFYYQNEDIKSIWKLINENSISLDDSISQVYWEAFSWPCKIVNEFERAQNRLEESRIHIKQQLDIDKNHCLSSIEAYKSEIAVYEGLQTLNNCLEVYSQIKSLRERLNKVFTLVESINVRSKCIGIDQFSIDHTKDSLEAFEKFETLWLLVYDSTETIQQWKDTIFLDLVAEKMVQKIDSWFKSISSLSLQFKEDSSPKVILDQVHKKLIYFNRFTSILIALLNPALKEKHWSQITSIIGISLADIQHLKLTKILEFDLSLVQDIVQDISKDASNDLKIETCLEMMKTELSSRDFISVYYNEECSLFANINEAILLYEDHLIQCRNMALRAKSSSLVAKIEFWMKKLVFTQITLEHWDYLQSKFKDLDPIFRLFSDWSKESLDEYKSIKKMVIMMSDIITKTKKFMTVILRTDIHEMIINAAERVDKVTFHSQSIVDLLYSKFSRFYHLSRNQVVEVMGTVDNLGKLTPYLSKMFDNVHSISESLLSAVSNNLHEQAKISRIDERKYKRSSIKFKVTKNKFDSLNKSASVNILNSTPKRLIYSIQSREGEVLKLEEPIEIGSRIDDVLFELDKAIKKSLRSSLFKLLSVTSDYHIDYTSEIGYYPFQVVYLARYIAITKQLYDAASDHSNKATFELRKTLLKTIENLARQLKLESSSSIRNGIEIMLMLSYFFVEVVDSFASNDIKLVSITDLNRVLRYYVTGDKIVAKISSYTAPYDFEYCGSRPRLVQTSITTRFFGNLLDSLSLGTSAAVIGSDNDIKIESLKELATFFGKKLTVVECCKNMTPSFFTSSICGSLANGSFLFFNNVDRLLNLLPILSQLISTIQKLRISAKSSHVNFEFDNKQFDSNLFSAIFIGTKKWDHLPLNTRSLFRPVAVNLPDINIVLEITLNSIGIQGSSKLCRKFVSLMNSISPYLENIGKYDLTYEIIRQIGIRLSGYADGVNDTRNFVDVVDHLVLSNVHPKDQLICRNIFHEVFGLVHSKSVIDERDSIIKATLALRLSSHEAFLQKSSDLINSLKQNVRTALVGASICKTSLIDVAKRVLEYENSIMLDHFYPRAVSCFNIFGHFQENLWVDGALTKSIRRLCQYASQMESKFREKDRIFSILVLDFDGDLELIYPVFDGNPSITLQSGEVLLLPTSFKIIIETSSIRYWNPKTIATCHIVHVTTSVLSLDQLMNNEISKFPSELNQQMSLIKATYKYVGSKIISYAEQNCSSVTKHSRTWIVNIAKLFTQLFIDLDTKGFTRLTQIEQSHWVIASFTFSFIWAAASTCCSKERLSFDAFFRGNISAFATSIENELSCIDNELKNILCFPNEYTVYEYYFDNQTLSWQRWSKMGSLFDDLSFNSAIVATDDMIRLDFFSKTLKAPIILTGNSGTGMTTCLNEVLSRKVLTREFETKEFINLASFTKSGVFKSKMESKLILTRYKNLATASNRDVACVFDDLNSDTLNRKDTLETWRQFSEFHGWYFKDCFTNVDNVKLFVGLSQTNSNFHSNIRVFRHFFNVCLSDDNDFRIRSITDMWFYEKFSNLSGPRNNTFSSDLLSATIDLIEKSNNLFRKTPANPHYLFSLREGVAILKQFVINSFNEKRTVPLIQNWLHDCVRVFGDRLSKIEDKSKFEQLAFEMIKKHFSLEASDIISDPERPLLSSKFGSSFSISSEYLVPTKLVPTAFKSFRKYLETFKKYKSKDDASISRLQLVEVANFDCLLLASKIHYSLDIFFHCVLVGVEFNDRSLITKAVCSISGSIFMHDETFEKSIDPVAQWKKFLHSAFLAALEDWKPVVIYLQLSELLEDDFKLEDINSIIKTGWVENCEEMIHISEMSDNVKAKLKEEFSWDEFNSSTSDLELIFKKSRFVRLVVSIDSDLVDPNWHTVFQCIPTIKSSSILWINNWTKETISDILQLKSINETSWHTDFIVKAFELKCSIDQDKRLYGENVPFAAASIKQYISTFSESFNLKLKDHEKKITNIENIISDIDTRMTLIAKIEVDCKEAEQKLSQASKKSQDWLHDMETQRETMDRLNIEIKIEEDQIKKFSDDIERINLGIALDLERIQPVLISALKSIEDIKKAEIYEIKSMISPPKSVLLVVECLCCLLKVELKPLDNIWDISKKMLGDSRFVQSIASFDKESLNATIMNRIEKLVNVPEFGIKDLYNTSQAVGSLGNWILAIEKYWQSVVITDSKKKLIGELNIKIDQIKQNLERKQSKKEEGDILLNKIKSNFDSLIKNKDSISKSYKDAQNRLSGSKEISKYLVATRERVVEQLNAAESKKHLVFGSVALGSSLSAFFLEFSQSVRESARLELEKWLDLNKILHEKGQSISSLLLVSIDDYNFHNLTQDDYNVDNIISTLFINNCILICDPYKQVYQRIAALERGKSFISLSSKDARFHDLMFQAVQQNSSIVLSVYENEPDSFMKSLLKGRFWSKSNMTPFKLHYNGQTIVTKFSKLYLVLECPYSLVSKSWLKYTIAIKGTLEIEALSAILVDISLPNDIKEQKRSFDVEFNNRSNRILELENKIANLIHELKDVDLSGGELFQSIKLNEAEIISVTNLLNSSKQLEKGVIKMLAFDKKISNFSAKIFLLMDSMSRIASYSTRLSSFLTLYKNITVSQKTERNSDLFGINVLRTLHIWYSSSYSDTDYLYLIFMFAIEYAKFSSSQDPILKIHASHWYFFLNGEVSVKTGKKFLADEFPINPSPQYIRKDCWERILALSRLPEFSKFAMEFVRYANRATTPPTESSWEDVFQSVDPLQSSFPDRWENQLNKFEKLLVIQCLRPDALCIFIKDYITIAIGKEFLEPVLEILPYQIPASISMTCLVLSNTHDSIVYDIRRLASQRRIENFLTFLVLGRDDDKKIFEVIEDSISKGKWVVCQECQDDIKMTCKIWNRLKQLESGAFFNSNFRIWLLSQPCDSYPLLLYSNAHRIFVSKTDKCFFANLVSRIIPILEENLAPHEFDSTVTYRGLLLKLVIFYLVCNYRNSYVPLSIFHSRTFNESDLKVSIKMLRTMFKENTPNSIEKDLSSRWMSIFGELAFSSQIGDSWDKRNLNSLFEDFTMLDFASDHAFTNAKAFKKILDMMNRNESKSFNQTLELFNDALDFFGLNANAQQVYLKMQSQNVYQSIKFFNSSQVKIQKQSIWANFENVNSIATKFVSQINNLTFKTVLDLKTSFVEPIVDLHYRFKHMDKVLIDNINRYRNLSRQITSDLDHLSFCLYNGLDDVSISICNQIIENVVPTEWKFNMYKTRASFSDFIDDLISRFEFIIEWFNSRFGSYSTIFKGLVSYKIGYLFNPKSFVYAMLLDHAASSHVAIETIDIDTMILQKQITPPDRGYYLSGLHLVNASWDSMRNVLKDISTNTATFELTCLWIQPLVKHDMESVGGKQVGTSIKRNWQKYQIPWFQFIGSGSDEEFVTGEFEYGSLYITCLEMTSDTATRFWIKRNTCLICQI